MRSQINTYMNIAETDWFILKKVGRAALPVEYFKPLASVGPDGTEGVRDNLLPPQIENILLDNGNAGPTPPGMMDLDEYFKTFDPAVVRQREKVATVAIENIRQQVFAQAEREGRDRQATVRMFERRRQDYLDFCNPEKVSGFKDKACGYLLAAAADYLKRRPVEREIIRYLRREEAADFQAHIGGRTRSGKSLTALWADSDISTFDRFRYLVFRLIEDPADAELDAIIHSHPAVYNAESGYFI